MAPSVVQSSCRWSPTVARGPIQQASLVMLVRVRCQPRGVAPPGRRAPSCGGGTGTSSPSSQASGALEPQPGWGMEDVYDCLADRVLTRYQAGPSGRRFIVGIAGSPGSGKSTLAERVVRRINTKAGQEVAVQLPMDGFHVYRRQLDEMPNSAAAHARRGAHWTFDGAAYVAFLKRCREGEAVVAPSFDHGKGDPVEADIPVLPQHRIVVSEGNYVLLNMQPWCELTDVFDDSWFLDCDLDTAMQRVYTRQTRNGVPPEVSRARVAGNDRPNGELVQSTKSRAHLVVPNLPFKAAAPER